jgi:hypothetical protein
MNPILIPDEVNQLVAALMSSPLDTTMARPLLFQSVSKSITGLLQGGLPPMLQLRSDIGTMNNVRRLSNGEVPLQLYLQNAAMLLEGTQQAEVIKSLLSEVTSRTSGAPQLDVTTLPDLKEALVHQDDTLPAAFMKAGIEVGPSVMKLRVPRFENGQPRLSGTDRTYYLGTGWLITDSLLMTNHHVVNARDDGEPSASEADLRLQSANTLLICDFDNSSLPEKPPIIALQLEVANPALDYALLRVPPFTDRAHLRRATTAAQKGEAVNIVQHPGGRAKRYGIRNNLVSATTEIDIRYFTDTEAGSSGSPVFNDNWEVVGLHRGAKFVTGVQFQGKPTAWVNQGTPLAAILAHVKANHHALATELAL